MRGVVTTVGSLDAVSFLHGWVTRTVLDWVSALLRKDIAVHKTTCVASCAELRLRLIDDLAEFGVAVKRGGDMLGIDYAAGGDLRARPTQVARRRKANRRKGRITWLHRMGGPARRVARQGALPEHSFGSEVVGLPPPALRDARAIHGASSGITCGGASLTAKLALGGERFGEHDPAVLHHNPPLRLLLKQIWDIPRMRADFVRAWHRARDEITLPDDGVNWGKINGPVSAADAHLHRIGASWPKAFRITALNSTIDLLKVPPRTVMRILAVQARRHADHALLRRLAVAQGWDAEAVIRRYRFGIHWDLLRDMLNGKRGNLTAREKRILHIVIVGGFWPEQRRYDCGLSGSALCTACGIEAGTSYHRIHDCGAFEADKVLSRAAGESCNLPPEAYDPELAPLLLMGLPAFPLDWREEEVTIVEGEMPMVMSGSLYGDGSGLHQTIPRCRVATWALVKLDPRNPTAVRPAAIVRGTVGGWEQTVPRAELTALIAHLRHSTTGTVYVGDCRYVLDGAEGGVKQHLMSSGSADPDLWRVVDMLIRDHGAPPPLVKVRAHRSRATAVLEGDVEVENWYGNDQADQAARNLCHRRLMTDRRRQLLSHEEELAVRTITCVARGAALAMTRWPEDTPHRKKLSKGRNSDDTHTDVDESHVIRRNAAGHFECVVCKRVAYTPAGARRMGATLCGGTISAAIHQSHHLGLSQGLTWCTACGAFSSRWPRQLLRPCPRRPRSIAQRNVLRRLTAGLTPTTAAYLNDVARSSGRPAGTVDVVMTIDNAGNIGDHSDGGGALHGRQGPPPADPRVRADPKCRADALHVELNDSTREHKRVINLTKPHCYFRLGKTEPGPSLGSSAASAVASSPPAAGVAAPVHDQRGSRAPHWSRRVACHGPKSLTPCTVCESLTRIRCSQCRQGLCLQCARANLPCRACQREISVAAPSPVSDPRRRLRGKQPPPSTGHHRSHPHLGSCAAAEGSPGPMSQDGLNVNHQHHQPTVPPLSGPREQQQFHHAAVDSSECECGEYSPAFSLSHAAHGEHRHDHQVVDVSPSGQSHESFVAPKSRSGTAASEVSDHRHHHHFPCDDRSHDPLSQGSVSNATGLCEGEDHSNTAAAAAAPPSAGLSTRSVLLLSQGLVAVAACAADMSNTK